MLLFQSALEAHQSGLPHEAEQAYLQVLAEDPRHADALHLLGLLYADRGELAQAETLIRRALGIDENSIYLVNLANMLIDQHRETEGEALLHRAIQLAPGYAAAHYNIATLFADTERRNEAEAAFRRALDHDADFVPALINLASLLIGAERFPEAEPYCRRAFLLDARRERAQHNLGMVLLKTGRHQEAQSVFRRVLELEPEHCEACNGRAVALMKDYRYEEAESFVRRALNLDPEHRVATRNLAHILCMTHRRAEAEEAYRKVIEREPDSVSEQYALAQHLLTEGRYIEGWQRYEIRYDPRMEPHAIPTPNVDYPQWQGESLQGRSLLVWPEQGLGDLLQFVRYLPLLKARGVANLSIACPRALHSLFELIEGVDHCIPLDGQHDVPPHDYWCFLMSLPHRFETTLDTIPASMPYLRAPEERIAHWKRRLPASGFKVGLVWAGDPRPHQPDANAVDQRRSLHALAFLPLLQVPGVTFVSLQKGATTQPQINDIPSEYRPIDPMNEVRDFADTAAIVESLDLVIAVDTSTAHLVGALNKPVWILSRFDACWRWLERREDSPWYPNARLFRQTRPGAWDDVIQRVKAALEKQAAAPDR